MKMMAVPNAEIRRRERAVLMRQFVSDVFMFGALGSIMLFLVACLVLAAPPA